MKTSKGDALAERVYCLLSEMQLPQFGGVTKIDDGQSEEPSNVFFWKKDIEPEHKKIHGLTPLTDNIQRAISAREELVSIGSPVVEYLWDSSVPDLDRLLVDIATQDPSATENIAKKLSYENDKDKSLIRFAEKIGSPAVLDVLESTLLKASSSSYTGILKCISGIDESRARSLAEKIYQRETFWNNLTYHTVCAVAMLRDWKFEELPDVINIIVQSYRTDASENIEHIFTSVYRQDPRVIDLIKQDQRVVNRIIQYMKLDSDRKTKPLGFLSILGETATDKAVEYLIETMQNKNLEKLRSEYRRIESRGDSYKTVEDTNQMRELKAEIIFMVNTKLAIRKASAQGSLKAKQYLDETRDFYERASDLYGRTISTVKAVLK